MLRHGFGSGEFDRFLVDFCEMDADYAEDPYPRPSSCFVHLEVQKNIHYVQELELLNRCSLQVIPHL